MVDSGDSGQPETVEAVIRARIAAGLGGWQGAIDNGLPLALFTVVYVALGSLGIAVTLAAMAAAGALLRRLWRREPLRHAVSGLAAVAIGGSLAGWSGQAADAFLPDLFKAGLWALALSVSIVLRWPLAGFLIGAVLGQTLSWRRHPPLLRLADHITLILLLPMLIRLGIQLPLFLADEVGWLGATRLLLDWPLHAIALAAAGGLLACGRTPLPVELRPMK